MVDSVQPVRGMVWVHVRKTVRLYGANGAEEVPAKLAVTKVDRANNVVYSRYVDGYDHASRLKTPLSRFSEFMAEVVSMPESKDQGPVFTDAEAAELFARAEEAGRAAAVAVTPEPMVVVQRANPFDDNSPIVRQYEPVAAGVCGFAWVKVRPANGSFGRWLKKTGRAHGVSYTGGYDLWVSAYNQSYERKSAHADAMAKVLRDAGVQAYGQGRLD